MYVLGGNMSGIVYVLGGIEWDSVCIGWYHERDSCMYRVVT